jgi:hypothetical protein
MFRMLLLLAGGTRSSVAPQQTPADECQPLDSIHRHQPQFHIIGSMQPGVNGTLWPGGVNDANAVFEHKGIFHVMCARIIYHHATHTRTPMQR